LVAANIFPSKSLIVKDNPNTLRPYVLPHLHGTLLQLGDTPFRFPITGSTTNNSFTLLTTNGDISPGLNVFAHRHVRRYENFFCSRGGVQVWTQQYNGVQNVRKLGPGDSAHSPSNVTHTFQIVEANTDMFGVVFDGGLE
jgi:quercetin dioxygenase-like cupin family protein